MSFPKMGWMLTYQLFLAHELPYASSHRARSAVLLLWCLHQNNDFISLQLKLIAVAKILSAFSKTGASNYGTALVAE